MEFSPHPFNLQLIPSAHFMPGTKLGTEVSEIKKDTELLTRKFMLVA